MSHDNTYSTRIFQTTGYYISSGYYLRDDAMDLWEILSNYVTDIVNLTYKNENEVISDDELQDFCSEVSIRYTL